MIASADDLRQSLQDQFDAVSALRADDSAGRAKLKEQRDELLAQIDRAENLKIVSLTSDLKDALAAVGDADAQLKDDLKSTTDIATKIDSVNSYLVAVDKVISLVSARLG